MFQIMQTYSHTQQAETPLSTFYVILLKMSVHSGRYTDQIKDKLFIETISIKNKFKRLYLTRYQTFT